MSKKIIVFCGLSKNCVETLKQNLTFINQFKKIYHDYEIYSLIADSDSIDGSLEYLEQFEDDTKFKLYQINNLELTYSSRIERISICRNTLLNFIKKNFKSYKNLVYIPYDSDIDLFRYITPEKFMLMINQILDYKSSKGIFPMSDPYYYDIFALRAKGWVNYNAMQIINNIKKRIKILSFIPNYLFIFRKQLSVDSLKSKKYSLQSAFGGIGIYYFNSENIEDIVYEYHIEDCNVVSEHVYFNKYFKFLEIKSDWIIPAPKQHIEYNSYLMLGKLKYILRTIKHDIKNLRKQG